VDIFFFHRLAIDSFLLVLFPQWPICVGDPDATETVMLRDQSA